MSELIPTTQPEQDEPGWICETCIYFPPSASDGKPCSACDPDSGNPDCYQDRRVVDA